MAAVSPWSPDTSQPLKMLAIIQLWDDTLADPVDNTNKYFFLLLVKLGLDSVLFITCSHKKYTSFLSVCSLSILLADVLLTCLLAAAWLLGAERSFLSVCFLLANGSATFGALPLPMMFLGSLDYYLDDVWARKHTARWRVLRNVVLTLLVWLQAAVYAARSVSTELVELASAFGPKALVCEVQESSLVTTFILGLFLVSLFALLPFFSSIPRWVKEAETMYEAREKQRGETSDLFLAAPQRRETEASGEKYAESDRPPLWLSLTLSFLVFWMPYLGVSVACLICGFLVPAYVSVNLLWLECTNSFLAGVTFWMKSKTRGPHSNLPESVCLWKIYWHLSQGRQLSQLPAATFDKRSFLV
ncbi:unnamed protein product [Menidia menidia]|uniref:(Atlantic silverside) hypothetical protein n=1 Tax=Menidia menidia TaxID=238744 RepID=A0A8S4C1U1_9TELE|nr:unnamed protein product [Menidia menidia]